MEQTSKRVGVSSIDSVWIAPIIYVIIVKFTLRGEEEKKKKRREKKPDEEKKITKDKNVTVCELVTLASGQKWKGRKNNYIWLKRKHWFLSLNWGVSESIHDSCCFDFLVFIFMVKLICTMIFHLQQLLWIECSYTVPFICLICERQLSLFLLSKTYIPFANRCRIVQGCPKVGYSWNGFVKKS